MRTHYPTSKHPTPHQLPSLFPGSQNYNKPNGLQHSAWCICQETLGGEFLLPQSPIILTNPRARCFNICPGQPSPWRKPARFSHPLCGGLPHLAPPVDEVVDVLDKVRVQTGGFRPLGGASRALRRHPVSASLLLSSTSQSRCERSAPPYRLHVPEKSDF